MEEKNCCFIGQRQVENKEKTTDFLINFLGGVVEIGFTRFIFCPCGDFETIAYNAVTEVKRSYPEIKRAVYPSICGGEMTEKKYSLLFKKDYDRKKGLRFDGWFEEILKPASPLNSSAKEITDRFIHVINECDLCVFYYDKDHILLSEKQFCKKIPRYESNDKAVSKAYGYALKQKKYSMNIFELMSLLENPDR